MKNNSFCSKNVIFELKLLFFKIRIFTLFLVSWSIFKLYRSTLPFWNCHSVYFENINRKKKIHEYKKCYEVKREGKIFCITLYVRGIFVWKCSIVFHLSYIFLEITYRAFLEYFQRQDIYSKNSSITQYRLCIYVNRTTFVRGKCMSLNKSMPTWNGIRLL